MASVAVTSRPVRLAAPEAEVWAAVGDFFDLSWLDPAILTTPVDGRADRRHVRAGGGEVVNHLESHTERSLSYSLVQSQLPVSRYVATIEVRPDNGGCVFEWHAVAETSGPPAEAAAALQPVFDAAATVLRARFNQGHADAHATIHLGAMKTAGAQGFSCKSEGAE
eukprot:jgi/Tetstr1/425265/TSEL_015718.t1